MSDETTTEAAETPDEELEQAEEKEERAWRRKMLTILLEKLLIPVLVPVLTSAATAVCGWYLIGQHQLTARALEAGGKAASAEVQRLEDANEVFAEYAQPVAEPPRTPPLSEEELEAALEVLRERWAERVNAAAFLTHPDIKPETEVPDDVQAGQEAILGMDRALFEQRTQFPEDFFRARLKARVGND
jgi:hypothetical protein